jgi:hypothetical protein
MYLREERINSMAFVSYIFQDSESWRIARMMNVEQYLAPNPVPCQAITEAFTEAEKELSAFLSAVGTVSGQQCVTTAARHWMRALEEMCPASLATQECFRKVSLAAAVSLSHSLAIDPAEESVYNRRSLVPRLG